jgi:thioesterase domain-containing protein
VIVSAGKAINTALADTPEKQKQEEADSRRQVESALNALRAEKRVQDQKSADMLRNREALVSRYRDLHALTLKLHEQLQPLAAASPRPERGATPYPDQDDRIAGNSRSGGSSGYCSGVGHCGLETMPAMHACHSNLSTEG